MENQIRVKKMQLSDYDLRETLGTGILNKL